MGFNGCRNHNIVIGEDLLNIKSRLQIFFMYERDKKPKVCLFEATKLAVFVFHNNIMHQVGIPQIKPRWHAFSKVTHYK